MENVGLDADDGHAALERALHRLDEELARARGVARAVARIHEDAREILRGSPAGNAAGEEVVTAPSRKRVASARELVAGSCGKCDGSILFEVLSPTVARSENLLCPVCAGDEVEATYLAVRLRLMLKRSALEEVLTKRPQEAGDLLQAYRSVVDELSELIGQLEK